MENNNLEYSNDIKAATAPVQTVDGAETPEDKKLANTLCIISLICMFAPGVLMTIISVFMEGAIRLDPSGYDPTSFNSLSALTTIGSCISGLAEIAAWVLMIYVRVKFRKNVFGKVLMILYLGLLALAIIGFILLVAMCYFTMQSCHGF